MKRTCIQCGKEFELTNSEIGFYRKRKLALPKRCKECRESNRKNPGTRKENGQNGSGNNGNSQRSIDNKKKANKNAESVNLKKQEAYLERNDKTVTNQKSGEGKKSKKSGKKLLGLIACIVLVCIFGIVTGKFTPMDVLNQLQSGEESTSGNNTSAGGNNTGTSDTAVENSVIEEDAADADYTFRSEKLFEEHYEKHGIDMGFDTAEAYLDAANDVIDDPDVLHKIEAEDGDDIYFLEETNEFVVVSTDGYIRTYFEPEDGLEYYNRQ